MKRNTIKLIVLSFTICLIIPSNVFADDFAELNVFIKANDKSDDYCETWSNNKNQVSIILKRIKMKLGKGFQSKFKIFLDEDPCRYYEAYYTFENDIYDKKDYYAFSLLEEGLKKTSGSNDWRVTTKSMTARIYGVVAYAKIKNFTKASYHKTIAEELMSKDALLSGSRPAMDDEFWSIYNSVKYKKPNITKKAYKYSDKINEAILEAARNGDFEKIKELVNRGANINATTDTGINVFMALNSRNVQVYEYLYEKGANINATDLFGRTALMFSSQNGDIEEVKFLIKKRVNVNQKDRDNRTAIFYAAISGEMKIVKLLVENGAVTKIVDLMNETPLSLAKKNKYKEIIKYLEKLSD
jgi:hypothetical protein